MSQATAAAEAKRLQAIMTKHGVRCSIELQIGRPYSPGAWYTRKYFRMHHHTASYNRQGPTPSLGVCKRGRTGLPGPLCNGYGGRDLVYRIITMGLANHPGEGGPFTADGKTVPKDSARITTWGTEWEGGYEDWSGAMLEFMGRADAALAEWMARPVTSQLEHSTWTSRKPDRRKITRAIGIALSRKWWNATAKPAPGKPTTPPKEDTVALTAQDKADIRAIVVDELNKQDLQLWGEGGSAGEFMQRTDSRLVDHTNRLQRIEDDTDDGTATP